MGKTLTNQIDGTADVDVHHEIKIREREGIEVAVEDLRLERLER